MRSFTSTTSPSLMTTFIAPSPSTRASASVTRMRSRPLPGALIALALVAEVRRIGVEEPVAADDVRVIEPQPFQPPAQRGHVRALDRAEAAVAAAVVGGTESAAAGLRHGAEAGGAVRDHHANVAAALALHADRLVGDARFGPRGKRTDDLHQLVLVRRAALELEVDLHVINDRR